MECGCCLARALRRPGAGRCPTSRATSHMPRAWRWTWTRHGHALAADVGSLVRILKPVMVQNTTSTVSISRSHFYLACQLRHRAGGNDAQAAWPRAAGARRHTHRSRTVHLGTSAITFLATILLRGWGKNHRDAWRDHGHLKLHDSPTTLLASPPPAVKRRGLEGVGMHPPVSLEVGRPLHILEALCSEQPAKGVGEAIHVLQHPGLAMTATVRNGCARSAPSAATRA
eukprot:1014981-Prymnesium_polylepis.1